MREKSLLYVFVIAILLAACATPTSLPTSVVTENPVEPVTNISAPTPYPEPFIELPEPMPSYPEPGTPEIVTSTIPPSGYEPQPGDTNLQRDKVFLDLESSSITKKSSDPAEMEVYLSGSLSDPCHELRVVVIPPDAEKTINLVVYSVVDISKACIMVIKPFSAIIPLASYTSGHYSVYVNGQLLGEFDG
jgi:hypothetical protein